MEIETANCKTKVSECIDNVDLEQLCVDRPLKLDVEITGLEKLIEELHRVFSHSHVNIQDVQKLMLGYKSDPKDWRKYAKYDRFRYTRNLVDEGNGAFNIMILCWGPGHASAIHDHADSHCFMKLLSGSLEEVRYDWPDHVQPEVIKKMKRKAKRCCLETEDLENSDAKYTNGDTGNRQNGMDNGNCQIDGESVNCQDEFDEFRENYDIKSMKEVGRTRMEINDVCYINDALGLHRMENPSHVDGAVSLHLYCPPFNSCRVFDAHTGKPTEVKVTFWSMYGKKIKRVLEASDMVDGQQ